MCNLNWYDPLRSIRSLGSQKEKIQNMGQLAEARKKHLGQFFTPDDVAAFMWSLIKNLPIHNICDTSIGSARLLQYADPQKHRLFGVDVHADTVNTVKEVVENAGFDCEIIHSGMESVRPVGMDLCLINPPFSVHLESPSLDTFDGFTRMGRFGDNTSATSDEYAVIQALKAAVIVVALLPKSSADAIRNASDCWASSVVQNRLRAVIDLPANTFKDENANVLTSVVVFGDNRELEMQYIKLDSLSDNVPMIDLAFDELAYRPSAALRHQTLDTNEPTILLPVTGNRTVDVSLDGRKVKLKYACGFTMARVQNAILSERIYSTELHRLPKGVKYAGQGKLDVEVYLLQDDPVQAFNDFLLLIQSAGGIVNVHAGVLETIKKKAARYLKASMPLKHTIWSRGAGKKNVMIGLARQSHNVDPTIWLSPVIKKGDPIEFTRKESGMFAFTKFGREYELSVDEVEARFELEDVTAGWEIAHAGLLKAYPSEANAMMAKLRRHGIDKWLSWDFQMEDAIECLLKPKGCVVAWEQACGKSRMAAALIKLSEVRHGLIVVETRLIDEMLVQLRKLGFADDSLNVINKPEKLNCLAQINIIGYERLRCLVDVTKSKRITYAHKLRRRIGILIADEGEKLSNLNSEQCLALVQVSARKCYIMTGTPMANYPRDIHGLMVFTGGDGTAAQPYGYRRGHIQKWWITSMEHAIRGIEAVKNDYVILEWVSWEFADSLRDGAKREIPKIANVELFRKWLAPLIKRRLTSEPECAKFIQLPAMHQKVIPLKWDPAHLSLYLQACDDYANWYKKQMGEGKNNLSLLLARLQAVLKALNAPQMGIEGIGTLTEATSKQRAVVRSLVASARAGEKSVMFCENPSTARLIHKMLKADGIDSVEFHGGISIKKRIAAKDEKFKHGDTPILLCTKMSGKSGYNFPEADYIAFYDRSWSSTVEDQAKRRALRTERKKPVRVEFFELPGSLDIYQSQMVNFKAESANAGLDFGTPTLDAEDYLHMSTILHKFVEGLAEMRGMQTHKMRDMLKEQSANLVLI